MILPLIYLKIEPLPLTFFEHWADSSVMGKIPARQERIFVHFSVD